MSDPSRRNKDRRVNTPSAVVVAERKQSTKNMIEAKVLSQKPMIDWINAISRSDEEMTRGQEDLIAHLINDHGYENLIHPILKAKYLAKKAVRAQCPVLGN